MTGEETTRRTRRDMLAAAATGAAAAIAASVVRPGTASAASGANAVIGVSNASTSTTEFSDSTSGEVALRGSQPGTGVGVSGVSFGGTGLVGQSQDTTPSTWSDPNSRRVGVLGVAGDFPPEYTGTPYSFDETAVYGQSSISSSSWAIWGDTYTGIGVVGQGPTGVMGEAFNEGDVAVFGDGDYGATGVYGWTGDPDIADPALPVARVGVLAVAQDTSYTALKVVGKAQFSRSGTKSIGATAKSLKVTLAGVTTASYVLATLQTNVTGLFVQSVVPATGSFTINLNKAPGKTVKVAYFVIN